MVNLPPLPEPAIPHSRLVTSKGVFGALWTEKQMHEYGAICRKMALEEAAELCIKMKTVSGDDDVERGFNASLRRASVAIRELI